MLTAIILAAGKGTRMKSRLPKVLHEVAGKSMVGRVVQTAQQAGCDRVIVVLGHGAEQVREALPAGVEVALQAEQLGTANAVLAAQAIAPAAGTVVILSGDVPLLRPETLMRLVEQHRATDAPLTLLSCLDDQPGDLGRIIRGEDGRARAIVEVKEASPEQLRVRETNRGLYCAEARWLWPALAALPAAPSGEYYLTDAVALAVRTGGRVEVLVSEDPSETAGVNDRVQLAAATGVLRRQTVERLMRQGVTFTSPASCEIDDDVEIGADTIVFANTHLRGQTRIGGDCRLGPNTIIDNSTIGPACAVVASVIEGSRVADGVDVGPFSHLRSGVELGPGVHIGNFAEVKNSRFGARSKMGHFSYVGDASLGEDVNIGAGTVTCNFDGRQKHPTAIGDGAFIGSDTMLVAPVTVGDGATTGAGSVVTKDVPPGALAVGVPARIRHRRTDGSGAA